MGNWVKKKVLQIGQVVSGATPSTSKSEFWNGAINWITPNDLSKVKTPYISESDRKISKSGLESCSAQLIPSGNLVMSSRAPIGYFSIVLNEFTTNQGCKSIIFEKEQSSIFHYYNFLFNVNVFKEKGEGTTFAEISKKEIEKLEFQFPEDYDEQCTIATILTTIDQTIEKTEQLIAKNERIKTGLMQDLLSRGIDEQGNIRSEETHEFKDSPLGRIPKEWEVKAISELGAVVTGSTPPTKDGKNYGESFQFIAPMDISEVQYIRSTEKMLSQKGFDLSRPIPSESICVVCIGSTIGKMGMTTNLCTTNQQINTLIPHEKQHSSIIFYLLKLNLIWQLRKEMGLQAVPIVNKSKFSKMLIPFPKSENEIQSIAEKLNIIQREIEVNERILEKQKELKTGLMQDLLTGRVCVDVLLNQIQETI